VGIRLSDDIGAESSTGIGSDWRPSSCRHASRSRKQSYDDMFRKGFFILDMAFSLSKIVDNEFHIFIYKNQLYN
jgi:hypothetical protein